MKSPIFLFSLPRSGSTLLQRILMGHCDISSVAEPWLMLPFAYANKKEGVLTEYGHSISSFAFEDFINNLPNKENDYYEALGVFAQKLYEKQCVNNEMYFLDKTPRYYNIIPEIAKAFPNAKFIFLFRNPVHVKASMLETWCDGRLKCLYAYDRDLNDGFRLMSEGYKLLKKQSYSIQYETFVTNPKKYTQEICDYLDIEFDEAMTESFSQQNTKGRMGDPTGVKQYSQVSLKSLDKWKKTFNNTYRKKLILRYLSSISENIFEEQGYSKSSIVSEVQNLHVKSGVFIRDRIDIAYSKLVQFLKPNIWFGKVTGKWARKEFLN